MFKRPFEGHMHKGSILNHIRDSPIKKIMQMRFDKPV